MKELKSFFAPQILEYAEYRKALKFSDAHFHFLKYFDDFCDSNFPEESLITPNLIKLWFNDEMKKRPGCLRDAYFSINGFLKYYHMNDCILSSGYLQRKCHPLIPYILSEEELNSFFLALNSARWNDPLSGFCIGTMIRLIYSSGMRPNETRNLKTQNVNLQTGEILIENTKRHKERVIFVSKDMQELLIEYNSKRCIFVPKSKYFFVRSDEKMITQAFLWRSVERCWKKAMKHKSEIPFISPYTFRHQFASTVLMKWLDDGKDLFAMLPYLKAYMGHSQYSSTVYYIHMLPKRLLESKSIDWEGIDRIGKEPDIWDN